jgi:hypothetical protein
LKKLALLGATLGLGIGVTIVTQTGHAADHLDAPTIKMAANHMADLNDVYVWMNGDATKVNLVMTVSPADDGTLNFGPSVQYVFHVTTHPGADNQAAFPSAGTERRVICTFASNTSAQCWVAEGSTSLGYISGDPSATTGITSADGKIKLFAGRRSDPFFFNLAGFLTAQRIAEDACSGGSAMTPMACPGLLPVVDMAGCPTLGASAAAIAAQLGTTQSGAAYPSTLGPCPAGQADCFATFNTRAIVLQIDKTLLLGTGDHLLSVWASTHATP